jgi:hypothetical protein
VLDDLPVADTDHVEDLDAHAVPWGVPDRLGALIQLGHRGAPAPART